MAMLLDTSLWIGLSRARCPRALKEMIVPYVQDAGACVAEPVAFEVFRNASDAELRELTAYFESLVLLASPRDLWTVAIELGRKCRRNGISAGSIDLLIAAVAIHHRAELITFDDDFRHIARLSDLQVRVLKHPGA